MARKPFYEPGEYWGRVTSQALGESSGGHPQLILDFEILGKVDPADPQGEIIPVEQDQYGRTLYLVLNKKTMEYALPKLEILGFEGASFTLLDPKTPNYHSFVGREFAAYCKHDTYKDEEKEKWDVSNKAERVVKPVEASALRQLDAMFGSQLKKSSAKPTAEKRHPATAGASQSSPADDGIPF